MAKLSFYVKRIKEGRLKEMRAEAKWIWFYAKRHWKQVLLYTMLGLVGVVVGLLSSFVSKDLVDMITGHETGKIVQTFCFMLGTTLGNTLISQISTLISTKITLKVDNDIKADVFERIMMTEWEELSEFSTGDLLVRWNSDSSSISGGILNLAPNLSIYLFRFVSALVVMLENDWTFVVIALVSMPFSLMLSRYMLKKMRETNIESMKITSEMTAFNQESFSNMQTIKSFGMIPEYVKRLHGIQADFIRTRVKFQKNYIGISLLTVLLSSIVSYAAYGWGIYRVWSDSISYGTMTMFLSLSTSLTSTISAVLSLLPVIISMLTSARRIMELVDRNKEDYSNDADVKSFAEKNRNTGISICLKDVEYTYKNGREVFKSGGIEASPYETIALVGPSGEGKTTMLRIILALVRQSGGEGYLYADNAITNINGEKTNRLPINAASRQLFSYVPQGNSMLRGSIADNMRFVKSDASEDEIREVLEMACAWDFVSQLPDGINTVLKERGGGLSEGQAQRLSIARALLRRSPLLLLDEATSALDPVTERKLLNNIMKDKYPRTCIVTTHRPSVLDSCKRIYCIRNKSCAVMNEKEIESMIKGEEY
ncbi:MAG: ABC transporter ATP-binding protein/permease [Lachnospiraceae bacterium]|nr:ABC transporter ATP-binding protein/permease [Lachnospiraceae bacterium]